MKKYTCYKSGGREARTVEAKTIFEAIAVYSGRLGTKLKGLGTPTDPAQYATESGIVNIYVTN